MEKINLDDFYIVNQAYNFRSDIKRVVLTNNKTKYYNRWAAEKIDYMTNYSAILHPLGAYIFSFFNGEFTLREAFQNLSNILGCSFEEVQSTITPFINNQDIQYYSLKDNIYTGIPTKFIIKKRNEQPIRDLLKGIDIKKMLNDLDMSSIRYYIPTETSLMINNNCCTDCIYCYANTSHKTTNLLSINRIREIVAEASSLGLSDVNIAGGDFFLYKHWASIIEILRTYGYEPYISTKYPIDESIIMQLKDLDVNYIQFSLDTVDTKEIQTILNVGSDYLGKVKTTLGLLKKHGFNFRVKSVITKYNDSLYSIRNLVEYLLGFDNLMNLSIAPGEASLYKSFDAYRTTPKQLAIIENYINSIREKDDRVSMQGFITRPPVDLPMEEKKRIFNQRGRCSGNLNTFFILPDGKVTICEQMYWHPFFILGDLTNQSIMEVWNSEKALSLWNIKQDEIQEGSPCKTCSIFDACRRGLGNCWRLAAQAYGYDKHDYPTPECIFAPPVTRSFYIE